MFLFDSPENIFSASSELGIDGAIEIDAPDIDLQKELEESKLKLINISEDISNSCLSRNKRQTRFTINGNDRFPKNPNSNYSDTDFSLTGVSSPSIINQQPLSTSVTDLQYNQLLIPAQKMVETADGKILLVAAPQKAKYLLCQGGKEK